MDTNILAKYRGSILTRGILAIILGLVIMFFTQSTVWFLIVFIGVFAILNGLVLFISAFGAKKHNQWWVLMIEGLISVLFGVILFAWPAITLEVVIFLVALWAVVTGLMETIVGFSIPEGSIGKWALAFGGILSIILGILLFVIPDKTITVIVWIIGLYAFVVGIALTVFGFQIKSK